MTSQHTPGPWRIQATIYSRQPLIVNEHGAFVADTDAHNAYLIAAAPDMLAALWDIVDAEEHDGDASVCDFQTLQAIARATIAKVRGTQE